MAAINWLNFDRPITWDEANAVANETGGRLLLDRSTGEWHRDLADQMGQNIWAELPTWFGITATPGGGYRWGDLSPVDPALLALKTQGEDPNADEDPENDADHLVLVSGDWNSPVGLEPVTRAFIEYPDTASVHGTALSDIIFGGGHPGEVVRTGDGDDMYVGDGGGKIYLGSGDDTAYVAFMDNGPYHGGQELGGTLIFDGPGRDGVYAPEAVVNAAIDGADDVFAYAARVTYRDAVQGIVISPAAGGVQATGGGVGVDQLIDTREVVGGSGNDHIEGVKRIQGGGGDDFLAPSDYSREWEGGRPYAEGGAGNDTLTGPSVGSELRGGDGDDVIRPTGPSEVSGGAGSDRFVFSELSTRTTIVDLNGADRISIEPLPDLAASELFDHGYLQVAYVKGYTLLRVDADGGGDDFEDMLRLKGSFSQSFLEGVIV